MADRLIQKNSSVYLSRVEAVAAYGRSMGIHDYSTSLRLALDEWLALRKAGLATLPTPLGGKAVPVMVVSKEQ